MSALEYRILEYYFDEDGNRVITKAELLGVSLLPGHQVPPDQVWLTEPLTPLQKAAGFAPRVVGKIVNIGDDEEGA